MVSSSLAGVTGVSHSGPTLFHVQFPFTSYPDLQIYAVTPIPEYVDVLQMDRVPDRVKSFYRVNNVRRFRYDRPFHKGPKDKENEFKVNASRGAGSVLTVGLGPAPFSRELFSDSPVGRWGVGRIASWLEPACTLPAEPVDRAHHADPDPQLAGHLSVVRSGEEGAGEKRFRAAGFTVLPQSLLGGLFSEEEERKSASATHRQSCAGSFAYLPSLL